jgi:hypothetical protein
VHIQHETVSVLGAGEHTSILVTDIVKLPDLDVITILFAIRVNGGNAQQAAMDEGGPG